MTQIFIIIFDFFNNYDIKINGKAVFLTIFELMMKISTT